MSKNIPIWKKCLRSSLEVLIKYWPWTENRLHPIKLLRLFPRRAIIERRGVQFLVDPEDFAQFRIFEFADSADFDFFERIWQPGDIVIDLGASCGIYSLIAAKNIGPKGRVYAFEPSETSFKFLVDNIFLNRFKNIHALHCAIADFRGSAPFYLSGDINRGRSSMSPVITSSAYKVNVIFTTLNKFTEEYNIDQIDFLKVDVQGAEYKVLKGAENLLKLGRIRKIYMELHTMELQALGADKKLCLKKLQKYGKVQVLDSGRLRALTNSDFKQTEIKIYWEKYE